MLNVQRITSQTSGPSIGDQPEKEDTDASQAGTINGTDSTAEPGNKPPNQNWIDKAKEFKRKMCLDMVALLCPTVFNRAALSETLCKQ